jgi:coenzyme F420-reducing hydrogenase alpha subunit
MSAKSRKQTRTIKVDYLARVEGEGALYLKIKGDTVADCRLKIFEPPRFFEAFLRGRHFTEAPDITARICGICPVAYQMSSVHAMESICGVTVGGPLRDLRRLIYCGEWIESHVLHIAMLHAPDFLGYPDAIAMAKDHPDVVNRALKLKKLGNEIVAILGGREIHPINVRVGGFYRVPRRRELRDLTEALKWGRDAAADLVRLVAGFDFPEFERDYEYVALSHPDEYPFNEGRLVSNHGLDIAIGEYDSHFIEEHVEHSTALHAIRKGHGAYFCGPLARYNLNFDKLPEPVRALAQEIGAQPPLNNPFKSIIARALETQFAFEEALRLMDAYEQPDHPYVECKPRPGTGSGCTEAPRGICYHRYRIDREGTILDARIVPPTSQNQKSVEEDLRQFVAPRLDLPQDKLTWQCEQAIRNYDPCISCSVHFLKLHIDRE